MSLSLLVRGLAAGASLAMFGSSVALGGVSYQTNGGEYSIIGFMPGDQVHPHLSLNAQGGFVVWEDNITDGDGLGISAMRLDSSFSGLLSPFRVNQTTAGDQERARVTVLNNGGAAFVWQSGKLGYQNIYTRFLSPSNTWLTGDVLASASTNNPKLSPAIAALANGNVVVVWSSSNQRATNSMLDVYGQMFSASGQKMGGEFPVNQFGDYNQRTPVVAGLSGGGFVVVWISEQQRAIATAVPNLFLAASQFQTPSVDVYARLYSASGVPVGNEFLVNTNSSACANPTVAAGTDGGFMVAWGERDAQVAVNGWDVFARPFTAAGVGGSVGRVNTYLPRDQIGPQISAAGGAYLVVWTSILQDGSREGVFGQLLLPDGSPSGGEFRVNTTTRGQQMHPAVGSDGSGRFVVAWTTFTGAANSFDLAAQRYAQFNQPLAAMNAPFVHAPFVLANGVYAPQLVVTWPFQAGLSVDHYEVYVDGSTTASASVTGNSWTLSGLAPSVTHNFQVAYVLADGRHSPPSPSASGSTWSGANWGGIPIEWMQASYGEDATKWPAASTSMAPGGPTLAQVFMSGGNPADPRTWLQSQISATPQGYFLTWNPQPGLTYQIQSAATVDGPWANVGAPRFAAGSEDSAYVTNGTSGYFRVLQLR